MSDLTQKAQSVVAKMLETDAFSHWLGLEIVAVAAGKCSLRFTIRAEMLNGFSTVHGGILFSAADSAFAFACNSHGRLSVALDTSMSFAKPAREGEQLHVAATEISLGNRTSIYEVKIVNESEETIAFFKGTAFRTEKNILE
jgi:acyl-CoA thioesterase